jgi:hypothetical protein
MPNALVERLGGETRSTPQIKTNFGLLIVQIRGLNLAKSDSNQMLGGFCIFCLS